MAWRRACILVGVMALAGASTAVSSVPSTKPSASAEVFPLDEVVPRVVTREDPDQQYALYVPAAYDASRSWPALFVLDPRGQAESAMALFIAGAREHGWIVLSSYQSRSDNNKDVTAPAFQAMVRDANARFAIDPRRVYLAGMSGTAFQSWSYATMLKGLVAGVIGVGAGLPRHLSDATDVTFAYYGVAGWYDFNYQRQVMTDRLLDATDAQHRLALFVGRHGWAPEPFTRAAVDWMNLIAMKEGRLPIKDVFVNAQLAVARARVAEDTDPLTHWRRLRELIRDFDGLREIEDEKRQLAELERDVNGTLDEAVEVAERLELQERQFKQLVANWFATARAQDSIPTAKRALVDLQIKRLQKWSDDESDRALGYSAQRRIQGVFVQLSFYLPEMLEAEGQPDWAIAMLKIAIEMSPDLSWTRRQLAAVLARAGRTKKALAALEAAVSLGTNVESLRQDETWAPLHALPGWTALMGVARNP